MRGNSENTFANYRRAWSLTWRGVNTIFKNERLLNTLVKNRDRSAVSRKILIVEYRGVAIRNANHPLVRVRFEFYRTFRVNTVFHIRWALKFATNLSSIIFHPRFFFFIIIHARLDVSVYRILNTLLGKISIARIVAAAALHYRAGNRTHNF